MNRFLEKVAAMEITSDRVKKYLNQNYPADTLKWVGDTKWVEKDVPLSAIKMSRRPGGPREQEKVKKIAEAFKNNEKMEPVVLVENAKGEIKVADGYHRTLGCKHSGKMTIKAWVGKSAEEAGPWDKEMHQRKLNVTKAAFDTFEEFEKEASLLGGVARLGGKMIKSTGKELKNYGSGITGIGAKKAKNNLNTLKASGTAPKAEINAAKKDLFGQRLNQTKAIGLTGIGVAGIGANKALEATAKSQEMIEPVEQFNQNRQFQKMASSLMERSEALVPNQISENKYVRLAQSENDQLAQHNLRSLGVLGLGQQIYDKKIKKEN